MGSNKILLCVIGETARGKDTFAKILRDKYNLKPVISYATRPMRPGEVEGREHYFISDDQANVMLDSKSSNIVAFTQIGCYRYFATEEELLNSDIYVINPDGYKALKTYITDHDLSLSLCAIYITCSDDLARKRAELRGDNLDIFDLRAKDERDQFDIFDYFELYDYKYTNDSSLDDLEKFADDIMTIM